MTNPKLSPVDFRLALLEQAHKSGLTLNECKEFFLQKTREGLPPDPDCYNDQRASNAKVAIAAYARVRRSRYEEAEHNLSDLLCDLRHYADRRRLDYNRLAERALMHYRAETEEPSE